MNITVVALKENRAVDFAGLRPVMLGTSCAGVMLLLACFSDVGISEGLAFCTTHRFRKKFSDMAFVRSYLCAVTYEVISVVRIHQ